MNERKLNISGKGKDMISEQTRKKWIKRTNWLIEQQDKLNDWELGFIESVDGLLETEKDLTLKQSYKLGEIFKRIDEAKE